MSSTIDKFRFSSPKKVKSGSSIQLKITVTVTGAPRTLTLEASSGYQCQPASRVYARAGTQDDAIFLVLTGAAGHCVVTGALGADEARDAVEVT